MLSVCIPLYNYDVTALVDGVSAQIRKCDVPVELILIDDHSNDKFRSINEEICSRERYVKLEENMGRSGIRNLFLEYAEYENLLFLDCDSILASEDFIARYLEVMKGNSHEVVCGGTLYQEHNPRRNRNLRWRYGMLKESLPAEIRNLSPNSSLMTNNFMISRKTLSRIRFDERIGSYGHEDTLLGYRLGQEGITIHHMDNPVYHGDIETNRAYLKKTETGVKNLLHILDLVDHDPAFIHEVTLLHFHERLRSKGLAGVIRLLFTISGPLVKWLLVKGFFSLGLFNYYKLGILIKYYKPAGVQK